MAIFSCTEGTNSPGHELIIEEHKNHSDTVIEHNSKDLNDCVCDPLDYFQKLISIVTLWVAPNATEQRGKK